jgi:hypothetical protein
VLESLSISTLVLLPAWKETLPTSFASYFMNYTIGWPAVGAIITNSTLLVLLVLLIDLLSREHKLRSKYSTLILMMITFCLVYNSIRLMLMENFLFFHFGIMAANLGWALFLLVYSSPIVAIYIFGLIKPNKLRYIIRKILLMISPLFFIFVFQTSKSLIKSNSAQKPSNNNIMTHQLPIRKSKIALVFIFDELDQTRVFDERETKYNLSTLDNIKSIATFCTRAYPPTAWTATSIPSIFTGRIINKTVPTRNHDLLLHQNGEFNKISLWSEIQDFPLILNKNGYKSLFINHYHNFSEEYLNNRPLFKNIRHPYYKSWNKAQNWYKTYFSSLKRQWQSIPEALPGIPHKLERFLKWEDNSTDGATETYNNALIETNLAIKQKSADLIVVHWSIPHGPAIFDLNKNNLSFKPLRDKSNLDNLPLVDKTLAEIQRTLQSEGLWDESLLIITSDHWQRRASDPNAKSVRNISQIPFSTRRVPLIIKFPYQTIGTTRMKPINTASVYDLICAHFSDQPFTKESFIEWVPQLSPYGFYENGVQ